MLNHCIHSQGTALQHEGHPNGTAGNRVESVCVGGQARKRKPVGIREHYLGGELKEEEEGPLKLYP